MIKPYASQKYYNVILYFKRPYNKNNYYKVIDNYFYNITKAKHFLKSVLTKRLFRLKVIDVFLHNFDHVPRCCLLNRHLKPHGKVVKTFGKLRLICLDRISEKYDVSEKYEDLALKKIVDERLKDRDDDDFIKINFKDL